MSDLQGTEEWFKDRMGMITSSRFKDVMTKGKKKDEFFGQTAISYAREIVSDILIGEPKIEINSPSLDHGNRFESKAIIAYELETFNIVEPTGFIQYDDMIGGSPDGLVGKEGCIEVKCPFNRSNHLKNIMNHHIGMEYFWQVQGHLLVTGRTWCDTITYCEDFPGNEIHIFRVYRDQEKLNELLERLNQFKGLVKEILNQVK